MGNRPYRCWSWTTGLLPWIAFGLLLPSAVWAQSGSSQPSFFDSLSSGMKRGVDKIGQAVSPKPAPKPTDDPVALQAKGKPGIDLYIAMAHLYEEQGRFRDAEAQYRRAIQEFPKDLRAMLGYAKLKDTIGEPQEALKLYQRAAQLYPAEAAVHNHLAMHFARHDMFNEALGAADRAVQLRPKELRYRNNLATLLVEIGRPQDAFGQLRAVYDEPTAHYNLGFLLNKKGQTQAAAKEFATAYRMNPSLVQARQWLDRLAAAGPQVPSMAGPLAAPGGSFGGPVIPGAGSMPMAPPSPRDVAPSPPSSPSGMPYGPPTGREDLRVAANPRWNAAVYPDPTDTRGNPVRPSDVRLLPSPPPQGWNPGAAARDNLQYPAGAASSSPDLQRLPPVRGAWPGTSASDFQDSRAVAPLPPGLR